VSITPINVSLADIVDVGIQQAANSAWHMEPKEDGYKWHASQLCQCPRKNILKRAGYGRDPAYREGMMAATQGTILHSWLEGAASAYVADPAHGAKILVAEVGYRHPTMALAAKPDLLLEKDGRPVLVDYKTEKEGSMKRRKETARALGVDTSARPEHRVQLAATAMVLEENGFGPITEGRIWYLSRQEWFCDEQPVDLGDPHLRAEVTTLVANLDALWAQYEAQRQLPHRMEAGHWQCTPRKEAPKLGRWCEMHGVCFDPRMPA
jgi:hypothetical protein